jgi:hypothetical protein
VGSGVALGSGDGLGAGEGAAVGATLALGRGDGLGAGEGAAVADGCVGVALGGEATVGAAGRDVGCTAGCADGAVACCAPPPQALKMNSSAARKARRAYTRRDITSPPSALDLDIDAIVPNRAEAVEGRQAEV